MIVLDAATANLMAGVVTLVLSVAYILVSVLCRDRGAARLWALAAVLTAMAFVFAYVQSIADPAAAVGMWALGLSHAALVGAIGTVLLGCRAFNGSSVEGPAFLVVGLALLTGTATIVESLRSIALPGEVWLELTLAGLSAGVVFHALVRPLRGCAASALLVAGGALLGVYGVARGISVFVGTDTDALSPVWLAPVTSALVEVVAVVLVGTALFVLRTATGASDADAEGDEADILTANAFRGRLRALLRRSTERLELVAVIAVRVDDVAAVTVAFGRESAEELTSALRSGVRRFAAPIALVGESRDVGTMHVATLASSAADARRQAGLLYRGLVRDFIETPDIVVPGVGIGVALSQALGYDVDALLVAAAAAAAEASASEEASVVIATVRDLPVDPFPVDPI